jgi:hypothetical protein
VQRLVEDGFTDALPCVLLTAKGMPDLATRVFLHKLTRLFPRLPIFGEGLSQKGTAAGTRRSWYAVYLCTKLMRPQMQVWWIGTHQAPTYWQCTSLAVAARGLRASGML